MDPTVPASGGAPARTGPTRSTSALIFTIVFLDLLGIGIIAPLSPYLVGRFDTSGTAVALLTLSYSAAQFLATPVLGVLSDRVGRRRVLLCSILGSSAGYVLFAMAGSLHVLFIARIIDGFTGGNIATAQAAIADVTEPKNRAKAYGMIGAAFGLGFLLGPAFSAVISHGAGLIVGPDRAAASHITMLAPIWAAAALSFITACLVYFLLPETLPAELRRRTPIGPRDLNPFAALARAWMVPGAAVVLAAIFAMGFAHAELRTSFGVFLRDEFSYNETKAAWIFAFMGLVAIIVQGGLVRKIAPWLGDRKTALVGLPIGAVGYALIPLAPQAAWVYPAIALCGLGMGLAGPPLAGILSRTAPLESRGEVMGASQSMQSLGLVLGPIAAGVMYDHGGKGWPFWTGALCVLVAMVIVMKIRDGRRTDSTDAVAASSPPGEADMPA